MTMIATILTCYDDVKNDKEREEITKKEFGAWINFIRTEIGYSKKKLAGILGISENSLKQYEKGTQFPRGDEKAENLELKIKEIAKKEMQRKRSEKKVVSKVVQSKRSKVVQLQLAV